MKLLKGTLITLYFLNLELINMIIKTLLMSLKIVIKIMVNNNKYKDIIIAFLIIIIWVNKININNNIANF